MPNPIRVSFVAGARGEWIIERLETIRGAGLAAASRLARVEGTDFVSLGDGDAWVLHGVRSHDRYVEQAEKQTLARVQQDLGRLESTRAALIPITKSAAWWALAQDRRRAIFESSSRHISIGLEYLPAVARRLYHGRDLGAAVDFLTWFEYAPSVEPRFEELLARLRATEEWRYVDREIDIRLRRDPG